MLFQIYLKSIEMYLYMLVVRIAREIGTYDISIEENLQCKATPRRPTTRARVEMVLNIEKELNAKALLEKAVSKAEIISL